MTSYFVLTIKNIIICKIDIFRLIEDILIKKHWNSQKGFHIRNREDQRDENKKRNILDLFLKKKIFDAENTNHIEGLREGAWDSTVEIIGLLCGLLYLQWFRSQHGVDTLGTSSNTPSLSAGRSHLTLRLFPLFRRLFSHFQTFLIVHLLYSHD